jgi:hypothetical protein
MLVVPGVQHLPAIFGTRERRDGERRDAIGYRQRTQMFDECGSATDYSFFARRAREAANSASNSINDASLTGLTR